MAKAEAEIARLGELLADPGLYARDPAAFTAASEKLEAAQAKLQSLEDEWLELEMLREAGEQD